MMPNRGRNQGFSIGLFIALAGVGLLLLVVGSMSSGLLVAPLIALGFSSAGVGVAVVGVARMVGAIRRRAQGHAEEPLGAPEPEEERHLELLGSLRTEHGRKVMRLAYWRAARAVGRPTDQGHESEEPERTKPVAHR